MANKPLKQYGIPVPETWLIKKDFSDNPEFLGKFHLFDLNLKPTMTGPSRVDNKGQDCLTVLVAKAIDWCYHDLLLNILNQKWEW